MMLVLQLFLLLVGVLVLVTIQAFHLSSSPSTPSSSYCSSAGLNKIRSVPLDLSMIDHGHGFPRLGLPADQRKALLRTLTTSAIRYGRIRTTLIRAKALRKPVDHMITLAKKGTLHHRRQALGYIYDKKLVASLFEQAPLRYENRSGGYCRVIKEKMPRRGDNAKMAIFELV